MLERKLLKTSEVMNIVGISRTSLWKLECEGLIPSARRIGRSVRWNQQEIYLWIKMGCPSYKVFKNNRLSEDLSKVSPDKLIGQGEVMDITGVGRTTLWNLRSSGQLPIPISLGKSVRWRLSDIEDWITTQMFRKSG